MRLEKHFRDLAWDTVSGKQVLAEINVRILDSLGRGAADVAGFENHVRREERPFHFTEPLGANSADVSLCEPIGLLVWALEPNRPVCVHRRDTPRRGTSTRNRSQSFVTVTDAPPRKPSKMEKPLGSRASLVRPANHEPRLRTPATSDLSLSLVQKNRMWD